MTQVQHITDDISKCMLLNGNYCIFILSSLKFVPGDPFDNKAASNKWLVITWTNGNKVHRQMYALPWINELSLLITFVTEILVNVGSGKCLSRIQLQAITRTSIELL